jgi:hypothetical protein
VGTGPLILANAWGGAWAAAWAGAWGNDWGQFTAEIDEDAQYYGGGGRSASISQSVKHDATYDEVSRQWDLLELRLRNQDAKQQEADKHQPAIEPVNDRATKHIPIDISLAMPMPAISQAHEHPSTDTSIEQSEPIDLARKRRNQAALLLILEQA